MNALARADIEQNLEFKLMAALFRNFSENGCANDTENQPA